jgi:uncharacterized protein YbaP (TraB family)
MPSPFSHFLSNFGLPKFIYVKLRLYKSLLLLVATFCLQQAYAQDKGSSLLWEISGNGLKQPSYLYGTIHIKDKRVFNFNDSVLPKLVQADAFAMEIAMTQENIAQITQGAMLTDGKTLKDFFSKKDYQKVGAYLKTIGYDINMFAGFKPFILLSVIMNARMSQEMPESVDEYLYKTAKRKQKELLSIETVDEQVKAIENVPVAEIMEMINDPAKSDKEFKELVDAYAKYDLELVDKLMNDETGQESKDFRKKLLDDRNHLMADRISGMAKKQSTFAAIGAGHLPGKEGVIELLRKKGYKVEAVKAPHTPGNEAILGIDAPAEETATTAAGGLNLTEGTAALAKEPFEVKFMGEPQQMKQPMQTASGETQEMTAYMLQGANGGNMVYMVSYTDFATSPAGADGKGLDEFYDGSAKGVTDKLGAKLLTKKDFKFGTYKGKDMTFDFQGMMLIRMKNILIDKRLYTLQVITTGGNDDNAEMTAFFNSFKLKQ